MKNIPLLLFVACMGCTPSCTEQTANEKITPVTTPSLVILGTIQDAGSPHIGCTKDCCKDLHTNPDPDRMVVSLGIIDPENNVQWMIEATPDFTKQVQLLNAYGGSDKKHPDGIFLTHAHIGHYTGLMYLGREALGATEANVYAMPRMKEFLETNGPWSQLVDLKNISLKQLKANRIVYQAINIQVTPFLVPHRDEFSETVGFLIEGPTKKILFIPDIDKWEKWQRNILYEIKDVDIALIDGSFFNGEELGHRDMSEVPHPTIEESMNLFSELTPEEKSKVMFIHFNHTNPLLNTSSEQYKKVINNGYRIARKGMVLPL